MRFLPKLSQLLRAREDKDLGSVLDEIGHQWGYAIAISAWASFEREVDAQLWETIGAGDSIGACITDQIQSVRNKLIIIEDILSTRGAKATDVAMLRRFRNRIEKLTRSRNRLVHDPHFFVEGSFVAARSPKGTEGEQPREVIERDTLDRFSDECRERALELRDMLTLVRTAAAGQNVRPEDGS